MKKCLTCGGVYSATDANGATYAHVCPLLSDAQVGIALGAGGDPTKWTLAQKLAIAAAPRVMVNARNENPPDPATQKGIVAQFTAANGAVDWEKANAALETAVTAVGAGTTIV